MGGAMEILEVFLQFTRGISDLELYRAASQSSADREYAHLLEQQRRVAEWGRDDFKSSHNMFFQDCISGSLVFYGFRTQTIQGAIDCLVRHTNRQHQWFLAEAYELFEEYVKFAYAAGPEEPRRLATT
jgi:hypothetical protein